MGGETADDKRYRMSMQKRNGYSDGGLTEDQREKADREFDIQAQSAIDRGDTEGLEAVEKKTSLGLYNDSLDRLQSQTERKNQDEALRKGEGDSNIKQHGASLLKEVLEKRSEGGMMKYAEGSMLMPPEMGMEDEMPVDTYDNIPEEEMAAVEASQLPDAEMEEDYTGYVLEQSLDMEEQQYLMSVLETDERLGGIFDKVMDVAGEFAGNGAVEGLGDGTSDSIPARLSDGEFVFTKKATDQMGADQLQTMMDDAERAYDGGLMKKAFGGLTSEDDIGMDSYDSEEEVKKQMISANQMPSIR